MQWSHPWMTTKISYRTEKHQFLTWTGQNPRFTHQLKTTSHTPHRSWLREQTVLWLLCGNCSRGRHGCWGYWCWSLSGGLFPGHLHLCHVYGWVSSLGAKVKSAELHVEARYICWAGHLHCWRRDLRWTKQADIPNQSNYCVCKILWHFILMKTTL